MILVLYFCRCKRHVILIEGWCNAVQPTDQRVTKTPTNYCVNSVSRIGSCAPPFGTAKCSRRPKGVCSTIARRAVPRFRGSREIALNPELFGSGLDPWIYHRGLWRCWGTAAENGNKYRDGEKARRYRGITRNYRNHS